MAEKSLNYNSSQRLLGIEKEFVVAQLSVLLRPSRDDAPSGETLCFPGSTNSNISIPEASLRLHPEIMFKQTSEHWWPILVDI